MKIITLLGLTGALALLSFTMTVNINKVKDYFQVPGPIEFSKTAYHLSWSDHPNDNYFKQEYIPSSEQPGSFTRMIMMEVLLGETNVEALVQAKMQELQKRKAIDPVTNYQLITNKSTNEYLLDFVLSDSRGKEIVEWNAYRYVKLKEKSGKKGVMLFAVSRRAYGAGTSYLLKSLKTDRLAIINSFAGHDIPTVQITR